MTRLTSFIREYRILLLFTICSPFLFLAVFSLYELPLEPFYYASSLYLLLMVLIWVFIILRRNTEHRDRLAMTAALQNGIYDFVEPHSLSDADYIAMLQMLEKKSRMLTDRLVQERVEAQDYYTLWIHQIKTPISAMRMQLQTDGEPNRALLESDLFRIEQYAEMALNYIRLEASPNDLTIREQPIDPIIRGCIRKYAPMFIAKKLSVRYEGTEATELTDAKWFSFILEQLLSNVVKYTRSGAVTITVTDEHSVTVSDTGIGIAPEDLPRIFDKGFTGHNGRADQKATGLGLYLCSMAAKRLGITISAQSKVGTGTSVTLHFDALPFSMD